MKPLKLMFSAFGPYAGRVVLDFNDLGGRTFFLIHGPTGAGKTTILDAICFALYGDSSGALRDGKTMRSDYAGADAPTEVEFTFAVGRAVYRARRAPEQRRAKKRGEGFTVSMADAELYEVKPDGEKLIAHGYSKTTEKIENLLGFKSGQFRQVVLLPQGEFRKLLLANSAERQEIMQTLFKTDLYKRIEEQLKRKAKEIAQEREALAGQKEFLLKESGARSLNELEEKIGAAKKAELEASAGVARLEKAKKDAQKAVSDGKLLESKFIAAREAEKEEEACRALLPDVEKYRRVYLDASRAAQLEDAERELEGLKNDVAAYDEERKARAARLADLGAQAKAAEEALRSEAAKEGAREEAARSVLEIEERVKRVDAALAAERAAREKRRAADASAAARDEGEKALGRLSQALKAKRAEAQALSVKAAKADSYRARLSQLEQIKEKMTAERRVAGELEKADQLYREAKTAEESIAAERASQQKIVARLQHLFAEGQAAILAAALEDGAPCPVCGSREHPRPALRAEALPSEAEVKAAQEKLRVMDETRQAAQRKVSEMETAFRTLGNRLSDAKAAVGAYEGTSRTVGGEILAAAGALSEAVAAEKAAALAEKEIQELERAEEASAAARETLQGAYFAAENAAKAAEAVARERAAALPEAYRDKERAQKALKDAREKLDALKKAWEDARRDAQGRKEAHAAAAADQRAAEENFARAAKRFQAAADAFAARLAQAGFDGIDAYRAVKKKPEFLLKLEARIKQFDERFIAAKTALQQTKARIEGAAAPDVAMLEQKANEVSARYNLYFAEQLQNKENVRRAEEKKKQLLRLEKKLAKADAAYGAVGTLAEVANGKNAHGLTFQRFVLKSLLEDVIESSNMRLKMMSRGQYALQSTDERARKNAAGGLELEVFDHYTGYARPAATLSGGETFLASLSLALGLADVVQSYAGGIRLDTILVDEGFGTLDPESLDIAMKALIDLQKGGRLVGIISHVPELKERIDARLEVTKGKRGSAARFDVG